MTLQDDLARHWFEPTDAYPEARYDRARSPAGPLTTQFSGELALDDAPIGPPRAFGSAEPPMPARVEVTQPFIPAIRERPPEFAKRLDPSSDASGGRVPPPSLAEPTRTVAEPRGERPGSPSVTGIEREPTDTSARESTAAATPARPATPAKQRSLMRRVVRRIIGPDLLRKDPAPKRR